MNKPNNIFEEGKVKVTCKDCNTSWMKRPNDIESVCPFCGKSINASVVLDGDNF